MGGGHRAEAGCYFPAPGSVTAELAGGTCAAEIGLGVLPGQPRQEPGELVSAGDITTFPD